MQHRVEGPVDLLAQAAKGDMDAFGRFYDDTAESVLRFFQARTACPDIAADLTGETFAAALGSLGRYRPAAGSGRAWLFGIARHQLSRYLRWRSVDSRARTKLGMSREVALDDGSYVRIEELVDFGPIRRDLEEAVGGLSPRLVAALRLRIGDELSFTEVANRLGCTEPAARARVSRALRQLAKNMEVEQ